MSYFCGNIKMYMKNKFHINLKQKDNKFMYFIHDFYVLLEKTTQLLLNTRCLT